VGEKMILEKLGDLKILKIKLVTIEEKQSRRFTKGLFQNLSKLGMNPNTHIIVIHCFLVKKTRVVLGMTLDQIMHKKTIIT